MRAVPARVECYAGYRAEESPRAVELDGRMRRVEIVDAWRTPEARWFRVRDEAGGVHLLHHEEAADLWWLEQTPTG